MASLGSFFGSLDSKLAIFIDCFAFRGRFLTFFGGFRCPPVSLSYKGVSCKSNVFFDISLECLLRRTLDPSGSLPGSLLDDLGPLLGALGASWAASWLPRAAQDAAKKLPKIRRSEKKAPQERIFPCLGASWALLALSWPLLASSGGLRGSILASPWPP